MNLRLGVSCLQNTSGASRGYVGGSWRWLGSLVVSLAEGVGQRACGDRSQWWAKELHFRFLVLMLNA
jgi:hypothetical protein